MNKTILGAILVLALMVLVSATTVGVMTVKPAKPVAVSVKYFKGLDDVPSYILQKIREGYIVKLINSTGDSVTAESVVIMEKY